jgi:hypothetical protein
MGRHRGPSVAGQDGLVVPAVVWAALDCPGGIAAGVSDTVMVLGRMAARELTRLRAGGAYCLVGLAWGTGGRPDRRCWTSTVGCWRSRAPSG